MKANLSPKLFAVILAPAIIANSPLRSQDLSPKDIFTKCSRAVVTIQTGSSSGTAFYDERGLLYTAYHVMEGSESATIIFSNGSRGEVLGVYAADKERDIAVLLTHTTERVQGLKFGTYNSISPGDRIVVIGSPLGLSQTVTEGIVSAKRTAAGVDYLQMSAGVSHGSSGSPVLDSKAAVVGMVVSSLSEGQLLNFAISSDDCHVYGIPLRKAFKDCVPERNPLLAKPGKSPNESDLIRNGASGLVALPAVTVHVYLAEEMLYLVDQNDLEQFISSYLIGSGVRVRQKDQKPAPLPNAVYPGLEGLYVDDMLYASLSVTINAFKSDTASQTVYSVRVQVDRAGFVYPGKTTYVTVADESTVGIFGAAHRPTSVFREAVAGLLDHIVRSYRVANGR